MFNGGKDENTEGIPKVNLFGDHEVDHEIDDKEFDKFMHDILGSILGGAKNGDGKKGGKDKDDENGPSILDVFEKMDKERMREVDRSFSWLVQVFYALDNAFDPSNNCNDLNNEDYDLPHLIRLYTSAIGVLNTATRTVKIGLNNASYSPDVHNALVSMNCAFKATVNALNKANGAKGDIYDIHPEDD